MKTEGQIGGPGVSNPVPSRLENVDVIESPKAWGVAACLFLELVIVFGGGLNTFVIFYNPFIKEFHWSRADLGLLTMVLFFGLAGFDLVAGWLLDRISARIVMTVGTLAIIAAFVWASTIHSFWPMFLAWMLIGVGLALATLVPTNVLASKWFDRNRGLALGFVVAGTAGGGLLMINIAAHWLIVYGWRNTYLLLALTLAVFALPLIFFTAREPRLAADPHQSHEQEAVPLEGLDFKEGLSSRAFWMPSIAMFLGTFALQIPLSHLIPYLTALGYRPERAAMAVSFCHGVGVLGCFVFGWLADRIGAKPAIVLCWLTLASGLVGLFGAHHVGWVAYFVFGFGLSLAAGASLISFFLSQLVGLKNFGSFWGFAQTGSMIGAGVGPLVGGKIYDLTGSYYDAFALGIALELMAIVCVLFAPKPRFKGGRAH